MNAATVPAPRSRMKSAMLSAMARPTPYALLLFLHRDEHLVAAVAVRPPHEDARQTSRGDLLQLAPGVGRAGHRLAVDREDDVAHSQAAGGLAARIDIRDEGAGL